MTTPGVAGESERAHRRAWWLRASLLVAGAVLVAATYTAWIALRLGGPRVTSYVDDLVSVAAATLAVVLTTIRAGRADEVSERAGWALLAAYCGALGTGDAIYGYYDLVLRVPVPFPSVADVPYLAGSLIGVVAVLVLTGRTWASSRARALLDGGIVAGALLLISWLTVLHLVYQAGGDNTFSFLIGLAYPLADVITAVIVLSAMSHARQFDPDLLLIAAGLLVVAVSDSVYAYLAALNLYNGSNVIDGGYVAAYLLIAAAAAAGRYRQRAPETATLARWQIVLPYIPFVVACLTLAVGVVANRPVDHVAVIVMSVVIGLVLIRQLTAVAEARSLAVRLDNALHGWKDAATEREILIQQAPVGICRLDAAGRVLAVNLSMLAMGGYSGDEVVGRWFGDFLHPDERAGSVEPYAALAEGRADRFAAEGRLLRKDGSIIWCSIVAIPLREADGRLEGFLAILEDVTERRRQAERAAHIQRQLLPQSTPRIDGYELAGACRPAEEVAGDFYDWVARDDHVDLTLADVMGKGVGAALVMAALRTALRSAPPGLGPAARICLAAESMALGMDDEAPFVTLFQGRLDPATGVLRYVDAGHGYCAVRRPDGELVELPRRSLPLGVRQDEVFYEGEVRLDPGDALIVYTDGLVETSERTVELAEFTREIGGSEPADETVRRLMDRVPSPAADDVTVVVLRRLPEPSSARRPRAAA